MVSIADPCLVRIPDNDHDRKHSHRAQLVSSHGACYRSFYLVACGVIDCHLEMSESVARDICDGGGARGVR